VRYSPLTARLTLQCWAARDSALRPALDSVLYAVGLYRFGVTGQYLDEHIQRSLEWAQQEEGVEVIALDDDEASRWDGQLAPVNETILSDAEQQGLPAYAFAERMQELIEEYRTEAE
tara:strand:+ start:3213 stop:3563 length:351 start_codon:yes stop_codon:yes gene_type:complete